MRLMTMGVLIMTIVGCSKGPGTITGSAQLPDCSDPPALNLTGTWVDQGTVAITSDGCRAPASNGSEWANCALNWQFSQDGSDLEIVVDEEYQLKGRFCGETLHLEGGWWLPIVDENGQCNYDDDDGDEVGIESGGNSLMYVNDADGERLTGTLEVSGQCDGEYTVVFRRI